MKSRSLIILLLAGIHQSAWLVAGLASLALNAPTVEYGAPPSLAGKVTEGITDILEFPLVPIRRQHETGDGELALLTHLLNGFLWAGVLFLVMERYVWWRRRQLEVYYARTHWLTFFWLQRRVAVLLRCLAKRMPRVPLGLCAALAWAVLVGTGIRYVWLRPYLWLDRTKLVGANLAGKDLRGIYLGGASLAGADLRGANLQRVYLHGANLKGADLTGADLSYTDFTDVIVDESTQLDPKWQLVVSLINQGGQERDLRGVSLQRANLMKAQLQGARLQSAQLQESWLVSADLRRAQLQQVNLQRANLTNTWLQETDLRGAQLQGAEFWRAKLVGARLEGAQFQGAHLGTVDLRGVRLKGANLRGADYNQLTRWPNGFNPQKHGAVYKPFDPRVEQRVSVPSSTVQS